MQDLAFNFDDITLLRNEELFRIEKGISRPFEYDEKSVMAFSYEHYYDRQVIRRSNYTFLGVLSDVGGLSSVIASVFTTLLAIINYNNLNGYMVNKLFKFRDTDTVGATGNLY